MDFQPTQQKSITPQNTGPSTGMNTGGQVTGGQTTGGQTGGAAKPTGSSNSLFGLFGSGPQTTGATGTNTGSNNPFKKS